MAETTTPVTDARTVALVAREVLTERHPGWSDEQLLYRPRKAMELCREVRQRTGRPAEDHDILRALINDRKRGRVGGGKRAKKK
jgi:hypothetical protein